MFKTIRSVVRLRKFEVNGTKRRLAKVGSVDDLRLLAKRRLPGGVFDYFEYKIMPTLTFSQSFLHLRSFSTSSQYVSQLNLSLVGLISPKVGISINYANNYDSQMPEPYIKKSTSTLTSGLQFKF